ncbi:hypothetical protein ACU6W1_05310 [Weissella cibaria]|uniref:hypothetical protein n=1 Tax=Weissella cibaria TaxID=137591 RepID=UPI00189F6946|nr:hypothetical protein [Weissella cibaria]
MLTILIIAAIGFWFYGKRRLKRVVVKADHVTPFDKMGASANRTNVFDGQFEEIRTTKMK